MALDLSRLTICYEAIQRVYRGSVIAHARTCLGREFGGDWQEHLKKPFRKEWDAMVRSAEERRSTGQVSWKLTDCLDYVGVNHFQPLFECYFDILFFPRPTKCRRSCPPANATGDLWLGKIHQRLTRSNESSP